MGKKLLSFLKYIIFLGGGLLLVWYQLHEMTTEEEAQFRDALKHADYILVIPVVIMNLLSHLSRSMRWKLLMQPLGYKPKLKNVFSVTMVGYLANAAVPRLGEVLKCTFLAKYEKLKADKLIGTILIERTFDLICYVIFILLTVLIQINVVGGFVMEKLRKFATGGRIPFGAKLGILAVIVLLIIFIVRKIFAAYPENKTILAIRNFFIGIATGFDTIRHLKKRKLFLAHTIFIWAMYLLQIYLAFSAIGGTSHLGIKAAFSVLSLSTLAMIITPGGIGLFPLCVMEVLTVYEIPSSQGYSLGWLIWGVSTGIIILAGLICLVLLPYINKEKHEVITGDNGENIQH